MLREINFEHSNNIVPRDRSIMLPSNEVSKESPKSRNSFTFAILINYIEKGDWANVKDCIKHSAACARRKISIELDGSTTRAYPLHLAVSRNPPLEVVQILLDACPNAIKTREEKWGRLPIHVACCSKAAVDILVLLVESYGDSLRITDKVYSRLPLHYACRFGSPSEISAILNAEKRALVFKDAGGKTPMDLALKSTHPKRELIIRHLKVSTLKVADTIIKRKENMPYNKRRCSSMSPPKKKKKEKAKVKKGKKSRRESPSKSNPKADSFKRKPKRILQQKLEGPTNEDISIATPKKSNSTHDRDETPPSKVYSFDKKGVLAKFLEEQAAGPSNEEEADYMSNAAQSMPTYVQSIISEEKEETNYAYDDLVLESARRKQQKQLKSCMRKTKYSFSIDEIVTNNHYDISRRQTPPEERVKCVALESYQLGKLALFLREVAGSDEDELDHLSRDAKSMPTYMGAITPNDRKSPYEVMSIADSFKLNESFNSQSDDSSNSRSDELSTAISNRTTESRNGSTCKATEVTLIDQKVGALQDIRNSLRLEYENIYDKATKSEHKVKLSRLNVSNIQFEIAQLQVQLDKEQALLIASENERQAHNDALTIQEKKINDVNLERNQLLERRKQFMLDKDCLSRDEY